MTDHFLQRSRAKLAIAKLLGHLDRRIRRTLYESEQERLKADWDLYCRAKELTKEEKPGRSLSLGTMQRIWSQHPMRKYITEVYTTLDKEAQTREPPGPLDLLSNLELDSYIIWGRNAPPEVVDKLSLEERLAMWRREGRRVLPVLPKSGGLPTNSNVRRRPDNREGRGSSGPASKVRSIKATKAAVGEAEGEVFRSLEDLEIH